MTDITHTDNEAEAEPETEHESETANVTIETTTGKPCEVSGMTTIGGTCVFKLTYNGKSGFMAQGELVSQKSEVRRSLREQDVMITSDKDWSDILAGLEGIDSFPAAPLVDGPGWTDIYFGRASGAVVSPAGAPRARAIYRARAKSRTRGKFAAWHADVAVPLTGQNLMMVSIMAALAAPLLSLTDEKLNFGLEISGPPAVGKTTALRVMAAVSGSPDAICNLNATIAGIENMFRDHQDQLFPLDETNLAPDSSPQFFKDFAFRMANGTQRVSHYQPDRAQYRFIFATTANRPFPQLMKDFDPHTAGAALQRILPLAIRRDSELGIFDFLPEGFATSGALASHLERAIAANHGVAMKRFLARLVTKRAADPEAFVHSLRAKIAKFEAEVGVTETSQGRSRATSAFGLLYAAGQLARHLKVLPKQWDCLAACVVAYRNYQRQIPSHTPLMTRLLTVAQREKTLDLRDCELASLTNTQVENHGAFLLRGVAGRIELLMTYDRYSSEFPDRMQLERTPEFRECNLRDPDHSTKQRQIRSNAGRERFHCFVLPSAWADQI